jgi:hypothetical protein
MTLHTGALVAIDRRECRIAQRHVRWVRDHIVFSVPIVQECASVDTESLLGLVDEDVIGRVDTVQASLWGDPKTFLMAQYTTDGSDAVFVLEGNGFGPGTKPRQFTRCGVQDAPLLATVPATQSDASWDRFSTAAAARHMSVQRCLAYFATRNFRGPADSPLGPDSAWIGFDGVGDVPISLAVGPQFGNHFDNFRKELFYLQPVPEANDPPVEHADLDSACHEFGHGVLNEIQSTLVTAFEWGTIQEGYANPRFAMIVSIPCRWIRVTISSESWSLPRWRG